MRLTRFAQRVVRRLAGRPKAAPAYAAVPPLAGSLLDGRCALVTGAGRNIGLAIALEMARQGATIVFTEQDADRAAALERELAEIGAGCHRVAANAADVEQLPALCGELDAAGLLVDVLVNNAALQLEAGIMELEAADWRRSYEANIIGPVQLSRAIAGRLTGAGRPGSILFISSTHQWEPACWPAYSSAKAALGMVIREMAVELAPQAIRVNGIAPGWVTEARHASRYSLLHGSTIDPLYIGRAAVALSSEHVSRYTTGTVLVVDAGLSLMSNRIVHELDPKP